MDILTIIGDSFTYATTQGSIDKTTKKLALKINEIGKKRTI